jgi:hypothetical protein
MSAEAAGHPLPELPSAGEVPESMLAQVIRQDRLGEPRTAFVIEEIETPAIAPDEVLIAVMAAGINFNNVWAAQGLPIDVIAERQRGGDPRDFHIGGSDASGIVYRVGTDVTEVAVGDEVIVHHGWWQRDDPWIQSGRDPIIAPSARIWGYQTNYGAFAVQRRSGAPVPPEAGAPELGGGGGGDARGHDRVQDAVRVGAQRSARRRHRPRVGRVGRARHPGHPAGGAGRRRAGCCRFE